MLAVELAGAFVAGGVSALIGALLVARRKMRQMFRGGGFPFPQS